MPRSITFVLAVLLGTGLTAGVTSPALASSASSTKQFCTEVSKDGGTTSFAQAATTGQGAAALAAALHSLETVAPMNAKFWSVGNRAWTGLV